ncbi:MAG: carbamoyltransferase HypF, partial [Candidatus Methylomirabilota bacterium]
VDDSIARLLLGRELVLRRARGYAPLPVRLRRLAPPSLAVGAHLKNTVAVTAGSAVFLSQHIGDLESPEATAAFELVIDDLQRLYRLDPETVACDLHPDYRSTAAAASRSAAPLRVQHHQAHVFSCMAENDLDGPLLGVAWDGTGYGSDGTVWGGEFFRVTADSCERFAHLRTFRLPGGTQAVREPRRSTLGLLWERFGAGALDRGEIAPAAAFLPAERDTLCRMLAREINSPRTSSAGRLFDGVAALLGLRQRTTYEGQAAMELEWLADGAATDAVYPCPISASGPPHLLDWAPLLDALLRDLSAGRPPAVIARIVHNSLAEAIVAVAQLAKEARVVLTGGCFQSRLLTEQTVGRLRAAGFRPYWHQRIPPNDGGIALGQILAAVRAKELRSCA